VAPTDPDHQLRVVASQRARELGQRYDDLVPVAALGEGFRYENERVSFGSFQKGIHRPRQMRGAAALTLLTAARVPGRPAPYEDELDLETARSSTTTGPGRSTSPTTGPFGPRTTCRSR